MFDFFVVVSTNQRPHGSICCIKKYLKEFLVFNVFRFWCLVDFPLIVNGRQGIFKGWRRSSFGSHCISKNFQRMPTEFLWCPTGFFWFPVNKGLAKDSKGRRLVSNGFHINFNGFPLIHNDFPWCAMDFLLFSINFLSVSAKEFRCKGFKGFPLMSKDAL